MLTDRVNEDGTAFTDGFGGGHGSGSGDPKTNGFSEFIEGIYGSGAGSHTGIGTGCGYVYGGGDVFCSGYGTGSGAGAGESTTSAYDLDIYQLKMNALSKVRAEGIFESLSIH